MQAEPLPEPSLSQESPTARWMLGLVRAPFCLKAGVGGGFGTRRGPPPGLEGLLGWGGGRRGSPLPGRGHRGPPIGTCHFGPFPNSDSPFQSGQFNEDMIPTVGFNMRKITKGNVTIKVRAGQGSSQGTLLVNIK